MTRKVRLIGVVLVLVSVPAYWLIEHHRGEQQATALFAGQVDPLNPRLESLRLENQQRRVICTDPVALRYLEGCFRHSDRRDPQYGITYQLRLRFAGGGTFDTVSYWFKGGFSTSGPDGCFPSEEWATHNIWLKKPMPPQVREMIDLLHQPWQDAKGTVLLVEPGMVRREQDRSLIRE